MDPLKALERLALEGFKIEIRSFDASKPGYMVTADTLSAFGDSLEEATFSLLLHIAGAYHYVVRNERR